MSPKIPALPAYPFWIRVNPSRHEVFSASTGFHQKDFPHVETSPVQGLVPMYQKFTGSVYGDATRMALEGHDVGPMVPHVHCGGPPDNSLLPVTMLSSSCKFPVTAQRRLHQGKALCAYFPAIAPYLYCSAAKEEPAQDKAGKKPDVGPSTFKQAAGERAKQLQASFMKQLKGLGVGVVLVPTGSITVVLRLGLWDLVLGLVNVLEQVGVKMVCNGIWGLMVGGQPSAKWYTSRYSSGALRRYARDKLLYKTAKDLAVGFARNQTIGLPYKLTKIDYRTGKVQVWTYESDGWKVDPSVPVKPLELIDEAEPEPADEAPGYWADPSGVPGSDDPQHALLEDLLRGAPHAA